MKWLSFFKPKRKKVALQDGRGVSPDDDEATSDEESGQEEELTHQKAKRRATGSSPLEAAKDAERSLSRPSLDQWFEARRARTSIDINTTTTTEKLTVCKAGVTTVINRTYIVIKHLGSGTYGQVKLAFNLRDHKLYAIKLCRKSQYGAMAGSALPSPRAHGLSRIRRSLNGMAAGAAGGPQAGAGAVGAQRMMQGKAPAQGQGWGRSTISGCPAPGAPAAAAGTAAAGAGAPAPAAAILLPPPTPAASASQPHSQSGGQDSTANQQQQQQAVNEPVPMDESGSGSCRPGQQQQQQQVQEGSALQPPLPAVSVPHQQGGGSWPGRASSGGLPGPGPGCPPAQGSGTTAPAPAGTGAGAGAGGAAEVSRSPFQWGAGGMPQRHNSGQVGVQRLGPGAAPRFRYSSAAAGMLPAAPPAPAVISPPLASPDSLDSATDTGPGAYAAPPAGAPPVFRKRPVAAEAEGGSGMGPGGQRRRAEEWVREIAIMKKLSHPNIVRLVEVIDDPGSDTLLLVMEYVEGYSLHPRRVSNSLWEAVPEHEVWRRTRDVLQGLDYLHYHGVVHGDLKPANLMLDTNTRQVKIVDFGSAVISNPGGAAPPGSFTAFMGGGAMSCTPAFRSPESLKAGYRPSFELDMWALGVTVYMWVFGQLPFNGAAPFLIYECIRRKDMVVPAEADISRELRDFLDKVLDKDPTKRLDVVGALNHAWVTGKGTTPLPIIQRGGPEACNCMDTDAVVLLGQPQSSSGAASAGLSVAGAGMQGPCQGGSTAVASVLQSHKRLRCDAQARVLSQEELDKAISRSLGGHAISELMGMLFEEVHLEAKTQIIRAGDPVDTIYLITQGEVEIYQELPPEEAAAAAVLLGATTHRSRILATVVGPPSMEQGGPSQIERDAAQLSGTLDRLQPFAAEPMSVDGNGAGPGSGLVLGSNSGNPGEHGGVLGPGSMEGTRGGGFSRWLGSMGRPSGEHKYVPTALAARHANGSNGGPAANGAGAGHGEASGHAYMRHSSSSAMDTDVQQQQQQQQQLGSSSGPLAGLQLPANTFAGFPAAALGSPRNMSKLSATSFKNPFLPQQLLQPPGEQQQQQQQQQQGTGAVAAMVAAQQQQQQASLPPRSSHNFSANPHLLTAAATSLAQPIISGLSTGHRQLFCGPHIKGFQKPLFDLGTVGEGDDDEEEGESFLDALVMSSMAPLLTTAMGTDDANPASAHGPPSTGALLSAARRSNLLWLQNSAAMGSGALGLCEGVGPNGCHVVILAVKGPGDTLGFASLEPAGGRGAADGAGAAIAGKALSATEGAAPSDATEKPQAGPTQRAGGGGGQMADRDADVAMQRPVAGSGAGGGLYVKSGNFSAPQLIAGGALSRGRALAGAAASTSSTSQADSAGLSTPHTGSAGHGGGSCLADELQRTTGASQLELGMMSLGQTGGGAGNSRGLSEPTCMLTADACEACASCAAASAAAPGATGSPGGASAGGGVASSMLPPPRRPPSLALANALAAAEALPSAGATALQQGQPAAAAAAPLVAVKQEAVAGACSSGGNAVQQQQPAQAAAGSGRRPTWRANVRTRGEVIAFKACVENMQRLSKEFPELEAALKHMAVQQETDLLVSEALRQLRLVSAGIPQHPSPAPSQPPQQRPHAQAGIGGVPAHHAALVGALRGGLPSSSPGPADGQHMVLQQQAVQ